MTAAHCCTSSAGTVQIVAGDLTLKQNEGTEQVRNVVKVTQHEDYGAFNTVNDICLLELDEPLIMKYVAVVRMRVNSAPRLTLRSRVASGHSTGL